MSSASRKPAPEKPRLSFFLDCGLDVEYLVLARVCRKIWAIGMRDVFRADEKSQRFTVDGTVVKQGDWISLDGSTGRVMLGQAPTIEAEAWRAYSRAALPLDVKMDVAFAFG